MNVHPLPCTRGSGGSREFPVRAGGRAFRARFRLVLLAALPSAFAAVDGTVVNRTTGKPQANVVVKLVQLGQAGMQSLGTVKTDAAGKFQFANDAPAGPQLVQALFSGVTYSKMIPRGAPSSGIALDVYDSSTKEGIVEPKQDLILLEPDESQIKVKEMVWVGNSSQTAYVNPKDGTFEFYLPPAAGGNVNVGATPPGTGSLPLDQTAEKTSRENVYTVKYPIRPGDTYFEVSYALPLADPVVIAGKVLRPGATFIGIPFGLRMEGPNLTLKGQQRGAMFYSVDAAEYQATLSSVPDSERPPPTVEVQPTIYQKKFLGQPVMGWILEIALSILGLGLALLYRSEKPQQQVEAGGPRRTSQARPRKGAVG